VAGSATQASVTAHPQPVASQSVVSQAGAPQAGVPLAIAPGAEAVPPTDPSQTPTINQGAAPSTADIAAQALTSSAASAPSVITAPASAHPAQLAAPGAYVAPASQVAPALLNLTTSSIGTQRMTLRLDPAELGTVQVSIDRPADAPAHVEISASRPETLSLLLRDQAQLQHTLTQAGVPPEGRTISFHLSGQDSDSLSRQAGGFDQFAGNDRSTRNAATPGATAQDETDPGDTVTLPPPNLMRWQRVGLDITA
jgi:flagellar hook-length control protein FliK